MHRHTSVVRRVAITAASVLVASVARADTGLPVLAVVWPLAWLLLIPIVIIEARMAVRVASVDRKTAMMGAAIANAVSTFAGIPLTWLALFVAALFLGSNGYAARAPDSQTAKVLEIVMSTLWLPGENWPGWVVAAATAALQIPFFFVSVYIEAEVFHRATECDPKLAKRWSWQANAVTYGVIISGLGCLAIWLASSHNE